MADVSNIRTDWEDVSQSDWLSNNAKAQANHLNATALNDLGRAIININNGLAGGGAVILGPLDPLPPLGSIPEGGFVVRLRPAED